MCAPSQGRSRCTSYAKQLIKGNEAVVKAAILAGRRAFYGYPITPASEIADAAAYYMPQCGGVFLQAEAESIDGALQRKVKSERWLELNRRTVAYGREAAQKGGCNEKR
jgi:Pyruvate flavodoxin/ferredoxin oxidoreductase, thiamine diP-bdg